MRKPEVHESWGQSRRVAYKLHKVSLWKKALLFWSIITSILGHLWLWAMAGQLLGVW